MDYQLIVIGAGPGGYVAALRAAKLGLKVAVVENKQAGGTCLNRGCVPTKTLLHSSQIYHDIRTGEHAGITADRVNIDMNAIFAHKRAVSEKLSSGIEGMFKSAKVDLIRGTGTILGTGKVSVATEEGVKEYTCENILAATGSVPARPPIPGLDLPGVLTSDELLEGCDHLYKSIVIIGGGVIGVEFATFYNDLGCDVTIIEGMDRLLPTMDRELGQNLAQILKKRGVTVHLNSMVKNVEETAGGTTVNFVTKEVPGAAAGEVVLCAIGRKPYLDGLFTEDCKPEMNGKSIKVDERYLTSIPGVYAIGDVSSRIQLAHVASAQGTACVEMLCGEENPVTQTVVPSCIYSRPEIAVVGLTEAECKAEGIPAKAGKCTMFGNAKTVIMDGDRSFMKVVAHAETHKVLGAQLMCEHATDMISQIAQAIANDMTAQQLLLAMRPHPTFEEVLTEALEELVAKLNK